MTKSVSSPTQKNRSSTCNHFQLGLDLKTQNTEDLIESVEVAEVIDEEQQISDEVLSAPRTIKVSNTDVLIASA